MVAISTAAKAMYAVYGCYEELYCVRFMLHFVLEDQRQQVCFIFHKVTSTCI